MRCMLQIFHHPSSFLIFYLLSFILHPSSSTHQTISLAFHFSSSDLESRIFCTGVNRIQYSSKKTSNRPCLAASIPFHETLSHQHRL
ncbi:hypothetical protein BCR41DRAFT_359533 [Lobosporangium transversale]|uniref:Secreted protein n=1 Tax=Lobosporangium transversale TaxID=64571 RepID=A0A1Y2GE23_9FUNG|nr:hypothetical protein BCR41DRAFT_359533 [Lobosporangium transversale]ORZ08251.1 hypothetical protein BCR41DRAFT_359533 [Lobosporangium transversale]|eukprot:XP_021878334.1 hypothetical protein BCR41DRAFT_359533 [Lobosporangium transversale]